MKKHDGYWTLAGIIVIPILSFVGGMAINAFTIAEKIATKPYVDDRFIESKKYTDDKTAQILREASEKADANKAEMMLRMEGLSVELKTGEAVLGTKVDALTRSVQDLRDWQVETHRVRH